MTVRHQHVISFYCQGAWASQKPATLVESHSFTMYSNCIQTNCLLSAKNIGLPASQVHAEASFAITAA